MNSRVPVAAAIGVGYLLGRTHKLRWALILGGAAATGRMGGVSTQVLERGAEMVRSTPELAKLADNASSLLAAGRGAAMSAMSSRAESITAGLEGRAGKLGGEGAEAGKKAADGARRAVSGKEEGGKEEGGEEEPDDESAEDEYEDEYDEDEDEGEEDEPEADEPEADEPEAHGAKSSSQRRPVARRGRR